MWDVTPCTPSKINRRFGGTCRSTWYLLHAGFLLGLFVDPEDGGDMFLGEVDRFSTGLHGVIFKNIELLIVLLFISRSFQCLDAVTSDVIMTMMI
jgi:hypothetical protein